VRVRKDGQRIHTSITISPVRDSRGNVIGASKLTPALLPEVIVTVHRSRQERRPRRHADACATAQVAR
jgi:hypothetical protein